jgi:hypothetical protein
MNLEKIELVFVGNKINEIKNNKIKIIKFEQ